MRLNEVIEETLIFTSKKCGIVRKSVAVILIALLGTKHIGESIHSWIQLKENLHQLSKGWGFIGLTRKMMNLKMDTNDSFKEWIVESE